MIVLVGFMGAGKTTIGRQLAKALGRAFVDADAAIEAAEGLSIADIFDGYGEAGFRRIEAEVITGLLDGPQVVLALGGGSLGSEAVREALAGHQVVFLDIDLDEALTRVGDDPSRPMLRSADLPEVFLGRQQHYRDAAQIVVEVAGRDPDDIVAELRSRLVD